MAGGFGGVFEDGVENVEIIPTISGVTLLACLGYLGWEVGRRKKRKEAPPRKQEGKANAA